MIQDRRPVLPTEFLQEQNSHACRGHLHDGLDRHGDIALNKNVREPLNSERS